MTVCFISPVSFFFFFLELLFQSPAERHRWINNPGNSITSPVSSHPSAQTKPPKMPGVSRWLKVVLVVVWFLLLSPIRASVLGCSDSNYYARWRVSIERGLVGTWLNSALGKKKFAVLPGQAQSLVSVLIHNYSPYFYFQKTPPWHKTLCFPFALGSGCLWT